ncbi:MAG TPA: sulfite exporter TauE/SafE family protein [Chloroflexia bacterium]|nr:sulfite exporter TauE/SafE family protein [Chloroflexia bacterium]
MDTLLQLVTLLVIGMATGGLSGLFGVGGGFILVPLLTLTGIPIKSAIALSLAYIIGTGLMGVFRHFRQQTVDPILALSLSISAIFTAQIGVQITVHLPSNLLKLLFGLLTISMAIIYSLWKPSAPLPAPAEPVRSEEQATRRNFWEIMQRVVSKKIAGQEYHYRFNLLGGVAIGAVVGLISGMFGVGGGFLMVPMMVMLLKIPMKIAVGTSLLSVIAPALSASFGLWMAGRLELGLLPALLLGGLIGVQIGVKLMLHTREHILKLSFNGLLLTVSGYMLLLGLELI